MSHHRDHDAHDHHHHDGHDHDHHYPSGFWGWISQALHLHGHEHASLNTDPAFNATDEGIRTVWLALAALTATSLLQVGIVTLSGSVALLADTVHNIGDSLNSIPLLVAFYLARRVATRRYTYGFGRAEDVAGVLIVLSIAVSAGIVFWESIQKLFNPQPMQNLLWVAAAAIVGFLGNEAVALLQIRTGRKIGSDAMIADGLHARIDGLTSLAVLVAVAGTLIGMPILDPLVGLLIGVAILFITRDATVRIWYRLMDAVDPSLVNRIEHSVEQVAGVQTVDLVRARWVGHELFAEVSVTADELNTGSDIRIALHQAISNLSEVIVQVTPTTAISEATGNPIAAQLNILPPRYQLRTPSAAPMGAAGLKFDDDGKPAWNEIWTDFCDLALAGGPPHRGSLLEPVSPESAAANPSAYVSVISELERGLRMVTGLETICSATPGWIGVVCNSEEMALWLLRAIVVENITVRREDKTLYLPAGPDFRVEREIKNVITVVAKTHHYWQEHIAG